MSDRHEDCVRFGRAIRAFREAKGLSQEDFADRIELHRTYIGGIERGERNPTLLTIEKIAGALGMPAWQLFKAMDREA